MIDKRDFLLIDGGVTVLIPAYNELNNLQHLLPELFSVIQSLTFESIEVLVVLASIASVEEKSQIESLGARTVIRKPSDSFGDALRTGFSNTSKDTEFIITMDADGSHDPKVIPSLLAPARYSHIVNASRYVDGGSTDAKVRHQLMSRLVNLMFTIVLGERIHDISGNFKLYRKSVISQLSLKNQDFNIIQEIVFKTKLLTEKKFVFTEVPYQFHQRKFGKPKRQLLKYIFSYGGTLIRFSAFRFRKRSP